MSNLLKSCGLEELKYIVDLPGNGEYNRYSVETKGLVYSRGDNSINFNLRLLKFYLNPKMVWDPTFPNIFRTKETNIVKSTGEKLVFDLKDVIIKSSQTTEEFHEQINSKLIKDRNRYIEYEDNEKLFSYVYEKYSKATMDIEKLLERYLTKSN